MLSRIQDDFKLLYQEWSWTQIACHMALPPQLKTKQNKTIEYLDSYTNLLGGIALGLNFLDRLDNFMQKT